MTYIKERLLVSKNSFMVCFLKGKSVFKNTMCSMLNLFLCILLSIKQKVSRLRLLKAAFSTDIILQACDHQEVFSPAVLNPPASMALSTLVLTWFCCSPVVSHSYWPAEGLTCVRQKHFKTSFQASAGHAVHCCHNDKCRVRWTRTELQADDKISPFIHWILGKSMSHQQAPR